MRRSENFSHEWGASGGKYVGIFNKNNAPALLAVMLIIKWTAITFSIVIIVTKSSDTYRYMYMHEFEYLSLDEASESSSFVTVSKPTTSILMT